LIFDPKKGSIWVRIRSTKKFCPFFHRGPVKTIKRKKEPVNHSGSYSIIIDIVTYDIV